MNGNALRAEILETPALSPRVIAAEDGPALVYCDAGGRHRALRLTEVTLAALQLSIAEAQSRLARARLAPTA